MTTTSGNRRAFGAAFLILPLILTAAGAITPDGLSWKPVESAPVPIIESSGSIAFPCVFARNDRCAWDGPPPADLDPTRPLEVTLSCDRPELVRGVTLYLRSGNGWYAAPLPVPGPLAQPVSVSLGAFSPEGQPSGWALIDSARLAVWKGAEGSCTVRLTSLRTIRNRVFVIQADLSAPGEKAIAETWTRRASAWLSGAGIGHAVITEHDWMQLPPDRTRFALLPYNPKPPPDFITALGNVIRKGGKLLVCYGASPELAALMGFRLAPYRAAPSPYYWNSYRFDPPQGPVSSVFQESPNLIPAFPNASGSRILARWETAAGERLEPAWLGSPAGYWTTHTLEPEDQALKTRVLLEWIGAVAPEAWDQAGQKALTLASAELPPEEVARLRLLASRQEWNELVDESARLRKVQAIKKARLLPPAPTGETAAVWAQPGAGLLPPDWPQVAPALKQAGIRRVYLSAVAFGRAHGESSAWPRSTLAEQLSDPFGDSLKAARQAGLSVHAWVTCFNVAYASPARLALWRMGGRLMQTPAGEQPWLTPTHPDNTALLLDGIEDWITRYPVDGVHLDYVRYSENGLDISPVALKGFAAASGKDLENSPADVLPGGPRHKAYKEWLAATLHDFVKAVRQRVRKTRPGLPLTAAVFPAYPYCRDVLMQDWKTWLEHDTLDAVCPMSYTAQPGEFKSFIEAYKTLPGWGSRIYPGIGIQSDSTPLSPSAVLDQVEAIRAAGGAGPAFFVGNREFLRDFVPVLQPALD